MRQSWTRLPAVPRDAAMSKSLSQRADKLDESFTKIAERRQEFDHQQKDVLERPVETVDFAVADRLRQAGHQLTRDELTARRALDDYIAEFHEWSRQAATAAFEELKKSQKAVRRKLVRAGYHDADPFDPDPSKILPGWIAAHPAVAAARQRHEEPVSYTHLTLPTKA